MSLVNCQEKIHAMRRGPCKLHLTSQSPMMPNNRKLCPNVGWFWVHNMNNCREWECPSVLEEQESLRSHDVAAAALSAGLLVHWDLEASTPDTYRPPPPPLLMEDFWDFWGFWKMSLWDAREAHVEPLVFTKGNISNPSGYQSACCLSTIDPHVTIRRIQNYLFIFMEVLYPKLDHIISCAPACVVFVVSASCCVFSAAIMGDDFKVVVHASASLTKKERPSRDYFTPITYDKLDGSNYASWSRGVHITITSRRMAS
ncbi:RING-H2 finger B1A [Prunus dulcis]|uniref:RING-H2 finger B1A n=1 Tax=Prunus dulcis TaxID=3755 RepID=A0A5H2XL81_PRUDU|nr:RING-H2 finger B1A [Prunus dulcis]